MNINDTKKRIENFLEKEIYHLVPEPYASYFNQVLDKLEGKQNGNEPTDIQSTESSTTDIRPSEEQPTEPNTEPTEGTDSSADVPATTEPTTDPK